MKKQFISCDGLVFDDEGDCEEHEVDIEVGGLFDKLIEEGLTILKHLETL